MVKSCINWIPSYLALKNFPPAAIFVHGKFNKNIIRTYNKLIGLWTIEPPIMKPSCRHGFCTNTLDVYLIYQSVITILKVVFIPETKKHCYRDYFQKNINLPNGMGCFYYSYFCFNEVPAASMYTDSHKLLMRYLIERLVPGTIIVPIDAVNLVVARLMFGSQITQM